MAAAARSRAAAALRSRSEEDSPKSEVDGAQVAAALLRLGKIGRPAEVMLVIEDADETPRTPTPAPPAWVPLSPPSTRRPVPHSVSRCPQGEEAEDAVEVPVVECDILLEEYESDDEAHLPRCLPLRWAPGSTNGRRLMQQRARQCVVCMEEKEHTFVPPHREDVGQHVDGHRFCTDCWQEFLQHGLQRVRSPMPPPLTCPLCRGAIDVPDHWGVDIELPASWTQASGPEAASPQASTPSGAYAGFWGRRSAEPSSLWADVAPGSSSASSSPPPELVEEEEECSPMAQGRVAGHHRSAPAAARWRALSCPVPSWQSGGYLRRLYHVFAAGTGAVQVGDLDLRAAGR